MAQIDDRFVYSEPGEVIMSQCHYCKHRLLASTPSCTAFPRGIPEPILDNAADHRRAYPGDQGVRFEAKASVGRETLSFLWTSVAEEMACARDS